MNDDFNENRTFQLNLAHEGNSAGKFHWDNVINLLLCLTHPVLPLLFSVFWFLLMFLLVFIAQYCVVVLSYWFCIDYGQWIYITIMLFTFKCAWAESSGELLFTRCPSSVCRPHFRFLLWNRWTEFNDTWQEARFQCPLRSLFFRADRKKMAAIPSDWLRHFRLLLWNRWTEFNKTLQEATSQCPLPNLFLRANREKKDGRLSLWFAETFSTSPLKPLNRI